jgi:hypothetical protein
MMTTYFLFKGFLAHFEGETGHHCNGRTNGTDDRQFRYYIE